MNAFMQSIATLAASCAAVAAAQSMPQITDITPPGRPYAGLGGPAIANVFMSEVAVHPLDPERLVALDNGSVRLSSDGGTTWRFPDGAPAGRLFVHPGRPGTLFMFSDGTRRAGLGIFRSGGQLWRSNDFGESWEALTRGYQQDGDVSIAPFAVDLANPERLLATERSAAIFGIAGFGYIAPKSLSVVQSLDGGRSWGVVFAGGGQGGARNFDPPTPAAPARVFMTTQDVGALVSLDGGITWRAFDIEGAPRPAWVRQDPRNADVLYAFDERNRTAVQGRILRSTDGGATWAAIFDVRNDANYDFWAIEPTLTIDPVRPRRLWLAGLEAGVFLSEDGGDTWSSIGFRAEPQTCNLCSGYNSATIVRRVVPSADDLAQAYFVHNFRLYKVTMPARSRVAVEYRYGDRFWITADASEALSQDHRMNEAARTGQGFGLWSAATAPTGALPICRFQGNPGNGQTSRFISLADFECAAVKRTPAFVLEGEGEYFAMPPSGGSCAAGLVPVRRFNNLEANVNHRYVADAAVAEGMRAAGWYDEGVRMCARPLAPGELQ